MKKFALLLLVLLPWSILISVNFRDLAEQRFIIRAACSDGESAERMVPALAKMLADNPKQFINNLLSAQSEFESDHQSCRWLKQSYVQAPVLINAVIEDILSEWQLAQPVSEFKPKLKKVLNSFEHSKEIEQLYQLTE